MEEKKDVRILGSGAFTTMYEDIHNGSPCAIKFVDKGDNSKRYIRKEVTILKNLQDCKYTVKLLDYSIKTGGYIKYEKLNVNLYQILDLLDATQIKKIYYQLKEAIKELHSRGVIHCDLKPENIMLDIQGDIRIIDFGNAMFADDLLTSKQVINTLQYRPPEYILGAPMDYKVDWWAFGCIMMELLTGETLFNPRRDNNVSENAYLIGEMLMVFGDFEREFLESGAFSYKYFDIVNNYYYKYYYLIGDKYNLYQILRNKNYDKKEAMFWVQELIGYFERT